MGEGQVSILAPFNQKATMLGTPYSGRVLLLPIRARDSKRLPFRRRVVTHGSSGVNTIRNSVDQTDN